MIEFPMEKGEKLRQTKWKVLALKNEREISADNGMWLTHPSHLKCEQKRIVAQC